MDPLADSRQVRPVSTPAATARINTIATLSRARGSTTAAILGSANSGNSISNAGSIPAHPPPHPDSLLPLCPSAKAETSSPTTSKRDWCLLSVSCCCSCFPSAGLNPKKFVHTIYDGLNNQMRIFPKFWMRKRSHQSLIPPFEELLHQLGEVERPSLTDSVCVCVRVLSKTFANPLSPQFRRSHKRA